MTKQEIRKIAKKIVKFIFPILKASARKTIEMQIEKQLRKI